MHFRRNLLSRHSIAIFCQISLSDQEIHQGRLLCPSLQCRHRNEKVYYVAGRKELSLPTLERRTNECLESFDCISVGLAKELQFAHNIGKRLIVENQCIVKLYHVAILILNISKQLFNANLYVWSVRLAPYEIEPCRPDV